jgi:hypothetical protein
VQPMSKTSYNLFLRAIGDSIAIEFENCEKPAAWPSKDAWENRLWVSQEESMVVISSL